MITPEQIEQKARKAFRTFLQTWLQGENFFPLEYPVGKLPMDNFEDLRASTKHLMEMSKEGRGFGYRVVHRPQRTKDYGMQNLPRQILIETEEDYLALVKRKGNFQHFKDDSKLIRDCFPELETWIFQHPFSVLKYADDWPELLDVCGYFLKNPNPGLYMREIPLSIHTKFIEQHTKILRTLLDTLMSTEHINPEERHFARRFGLRYDEPLVRLRLLDPDKVTRDSFPFHDLSIPVSELARWSHAPTKCVVVENKQTFLTLPFLSNTLALWGGGFRVELLSQLKWLRTSQLFYWGDIDAHGFQILAVLRKNFAHVQSVMMDDETLLAFKSFIGQGTLTSVVEPQFLTTTEMRLYQRVQAENLRLEQEHIPPAYALQEFLRLGFSSI